MKALRETGALSGQSGGFAIRWPIYDCRMHLFKGSLALPTGQIGSYVIFGCL
jgi:hypothetical protein